MSRANYRNLPQQIRRVAQKPKKRRAVPAAASLPPTGAIGSQAAVGELAETMANAQARKGMIKTPAAGKPFNPVAAVNPIQSQPTSASGGAIGKALQGSTGFRTRRK